ncbi:MAG: MFS transporter [Luminiphilus sp.]|nr:MFS transporter [Luminiphilus sp.]
MQADVLGMKRYAGAMTSNTLPPRVSSELLRYIRLTLFIVAGGSIYPLLYLRQNFELTLLSTFDISLAQLNQHSSILGVMFFLSYVPSGWVADRFTPRVLLSFSVFATGLLGVWYAQIPSSSQLLIIFGAWGVTTGLTFWSALLKGVALLAPGHLQARYFGLLEAGRGLFEALLASIAVAWFAYALSSLDASDQGAMVQVIYFYSSVCLVTGPLLWLILDSGSGQADDTAEPAQSGASLGQTLRDLGNLLRNIRIWLVALCILAGYQIFYATYSYSNYLQVQFGLSAVAVGGLTTVRLWMRPLGAVIAGFVGDRFHPVRSLGVLLAASGLSLFALILMPSSAPWAMLVGAVAGSSALIYGVRGIYWATFSTCNVAPERMGLAIGLVSMLGYTPEIYLPWINTYLTTAYPGPLGFQIYFGGVAVFGFAGAALAFWLMRISRDDEPSNG